LTSVTIDLVAERERVLFIGAQFSILYTSHADTQGP